MTPTQLKRIGKKLYGERWREGMSADPQIAYTERQIRNWENGKTPVPASVAAVLENKAEAMA